MYFEFGHKFRTSADDSSMGLFVVTDVEVCVVGIL